MTRKNRKKSLSYKICNPGKNLCKEHNGLSHSAKNGANYIFTLSYKHDNLRQFEAHVVRKNFTFFEKKLKNLS